MGGQLSSVHEGASGYRQVFHAGSYRAQALRELPLRSVRFANVHLPVSLYCCRGCMSLPWPLTIPGTISAPIYRFDSDPRDTRDYLLVRAPANLCLLIVSQESRLIPLSFVNNASCDDWDPWPMGNGISRIFGAATIYVTLWRAENGR